MDFFEQLEKEQANNHEKKTLLDSARVLADWQELFFGSACGIRVLGDFLEISNFFGTNFTGNSKQFFLEGMRFFVSHIIRNAGLDTPEGLYKLNQIMVSAEQRRKTDE